MEGIEKKAIINGIIETCANLFHPSAIPAGMPIRAINPNARAISVRVAYRLG